MIPSCFGESLSYLIRSFRNAGNIPSVLEPGKLYGKANQLLFMVELPIGSVLMVGSFQNYFHVAITQLGLPRIGQVLQWPTDCMIHFSMDTLLRLPPAGRQFQAIRIDDPLN